jgi:O-antigen/teichoic acid export membrane protein
MLSRLMQPAWAVMEYGWYPLLVLIATPYFVHTLGPEKYGHWMLLSATVAFGGILSAGTGAAVIKTVSAGLGRAKSEDVERAVRSSLVIAFVSGGVLAGFILAIFLFAGDTLFHKMGERSLVALTGAGAAVLAWIEQIDNVFASALKGGERFGEAASIEMTGKTIQILAALVAVLVWGSLVALYLAIIFVAIMRLAAKARATKRVLGLSSLRPVSVHTPEVVQFAGWGWLQGAGGVFFSVMDRMLVGYALGAASLAHYSIATQLAQQIHGFAGAALSVVFPKVSRRLCEEKNLSLQSLTKLTIGANLLASTVLALGLLVFGRSILSIWLGEREAEASTDLLWYLSIAYWFLAINVAPHFILLGVGRLRFVAISNLLAGAASLALMFVLVRSNGVIGIATAKIFYGAIILTNCLVLIKHLRREHDKRTPQTEATSFVEAI